MKIFFTSDQHFGHSNIIKYTNRPFKNVIEMNAALINNFNSVVSDDDLIYHLGDFAFKDHRLYLNKLNGKHHLFKGNHEGKDYINAGFVWTKDVGMVNCGNDIQVFCSHYAHRVWNKAHYGVLHAFGHSHGSLPDQDKSCDVGVDNWNYFPVSLEQLIERFKNVEVTKHH